MVSLAQLCFRFQVLWTFYPKIIYQVSTLPIKPRKFPTTNHRWTEGKVIKAIGIDKILGTSNRPTRIISVVYKIIKNSAKNGCIRLIAIKILKHIAGIKCAGLIGFEYKPA